MAKAASRAAPRRTDRRDLGARHDRVDVRESKPHVDSRRRSRAKATAKQRDGAHQRVDWRLALTLAAAIRPRLQPWKTTSIMHARFIQVHIVARRWR